MKILCASLKTLCEKLPKDNEVQNAKDRCEAFDSTHLSVGVGLIADGHVPARVDGQVYIIFYLYLYLPC